LFWCGLLTQTCKSIINSTLLKSPSIDYKTKYFILKFNENNKIFPRINLTTFSMGVFNTTSIFQEKIIKQETKYEELNKEYTSLLKKNLNRLENEREILEESNILKKDVEVLEHKIRSSVEIER
jgi:hypothetical protein